MREAEVVLEIRVRGLVQGVGFRPFVHRLAHRLNLSGWVRNEAGAVGIRIQGSAENVQRFRSALLEEAPPLARIDGIDVRSADAASLSGFRVVPSDSSDGGRLPVSPDVATCPACLAELRDPENRRYRYPFVTCTDCGPRFTVIRSMPYDRVRTSMSVFSQCPSCETEYESPTDRRYHSETNSCPACGPRVWFHVAESPECPGDPSKPPGRPWPMAASGSEEASRRLSLTARALKAAADLLRAGGIVAVRGLGGFHLAADATDDAAVRRLRERKGREEKPLAIMVRDLDGAREVALMDSHEEKLLSSPERPVVLLSERGGSGLAPSVAPGLDRVGVMVPYTPLHHLLLEKVDRPLIMTSGNLSEEPIVTGNDEALTRLRSLADGFLLHDREIVNRCDDSVVQTVGGFPVFHRRARGYAPLPIPLPVPSPRSLLAVGPHLKNTFALVRGGEAYVSQHIGDLETLDALEHFRTSLSRFQRLFRIEPEVVVRDLHPGYLSTRVAHELAEAMGSTEVMAVQHHHAHVAAVLAEHGQAGPAVGLAFDGTGYGDDRCVWGGEVLVADLGSYRRVGRLRYAPLPGSEAAVRSPWRTVLGYLSLAPECKDHFRLAFTGVPEGDQEVVLRQAAAGFNAPLASSMGRLFDAAAAVLGLRNRTDYDGQAPMELEAAAHGSGESPAKQGKGAGRVDAPWSLPYLRDEEGVYIMDPVPLLSGLGKARLKGDPLPGLARAFHLAVAHTAADLAEKIGREEGIQVVALCGGVFQNALLMTSIRNLLEAKGFHVLVPRLLSPNDGAISYGQAAVATARLRARAGGDAGGERMSGMSGKEG